MRINVFRQLYRAHTGLFKAKKRIFTEDNEGSEVRGRRAEGGGGQFSTFLSFAAAVGFIAIELVGFWAEKKGIDVVGGGAGGRFSGISGYLERYCLHHDEKCIMIIIAVTLA